MALEGTLSDMSLEDLLRVFAEDRKTGILTITDDQFRGLVVIQAGHPVDAVLMGLADRQVLCTGEEVLITLLTFEQGWFRFQATPTKLVQHHIRIKAPIDLLIFEARQRAVPREIGGSNVNLEVCLARCVTTGPNAERVKLDRNQWRVLSQITSNSSLHSLREKTGLSASELLTITRALLAHNLVRVVPLGAASLPRLFTLKERPAPPTKRLIHAVLRHVRAM
jgi:hypothetical protein